MTRTNDWSIFQIRFGKQKRSSQMSVDVKFFLLRREIRLRKKKKKQIRIFSVRNEKNEEPSSRSIDKERLRQSEVRWNAKVCRTNVKLEIVAENRKIRLDSKRKSKFGAENCFCFCFYGPGKRSTSELVIERAVSVRFVRLSKSRWPKKCGEPKICSKPSAETIRTKPETRKKTAPGSSSSS